jgi:MFS family permease
MGYLRGFMALGGIVGVLLGGLGHDLFGFTPTLLGFFLVSLAAAPMGYFSRRGLPLETGSMAGSAAVKAPSGATNPRLMFGGLVVGMVGPGIISSTLGLVLKSRMEGSVLLAGMAIGAATFSGLVLAFRWTMDGLGAPVLGALADRVGRERFVAPLFLLGAAAMLMAGLSEGLGGVVAGVMLLFFCGTFLGVLLTSWAGLEGPRAVATYVTAQDFGSAMGPIIGWSIAQFAPRANSIFLVGAGAYALALLVTGMPPRRKVRT